MICSDPHTFRRKTSGFVEKKHCLNHRVGEDLNPDRMSPHLGHIALAQLEPHGIQHVSSEAWASVQQAALCLLLLYKDKPFLSHSSSSLPFIILNTLR